MRPVDWERVLLVPPLCLLLLANAVSLATRAPKGADEIPTLGDAVYRFLLVLFYALVVWLLLSRPPALGGHAKVLPRVLSYAGSLVPLTFVLLPADAAPLPVAATASGLMVAGLAFSMYSVWHLGRSFSVLPQARALVDTGPYRWIRHPLYVGEIVAAVGAALFEPSLARFLVVAVFAGLQVYRTVREEEVLTAHLAEYAAYRKRTHRFIPGAY